MIDFHSHILPKIDDGSKSCDMSLEMLKTSYDYGIRTMVATPHFYISQNEAEQFCKRRAGSYEALSKRIAEADTPLPDIILGAEVYYFRGISKYPKLDMLKIGGTDHILLEMPFERWNDKMLNEIAEIKEEFGITPVMAHLDRYIDFQKGTDNIERLLAMDVYVQLNADAFEPFFGRGRYLNMVKDGVVSALGSDCHNTDSRRPNLDRCFSLITKKCGEQAVDNIMDRSKKLLGL
ncbi:MAG: capsular polysaccharide biosynthesis protein [Firmicutes bacterium]|nr:capsular polysaccharide biosynthesis protein [Bacillota bacterium]